MEGNKMISQEKYETWMDQVRTVLQSINMPFDDWQKVWRFDFEIEYKAGTPPQQAADKANRFWWREQNRSLQQDCTLLPGCWLPRGHQGKCEPITPSRSTSPINGKQGFPVRYFVNDVQMGSNADICEWGASIEEVCDRLRREAMEDGFTVDSLTVELFKEWESDPQPQPTIVLRVRR
jgi:hypothetical protein